MANPWLALFVAMQIATIQNGANQEPRRSGPGDVDQIICVRMRITGSRLRDARICRTRAEWDSLKAENQDLVDRTTAQLPYPSGSCRRDQGC